MIRPLLPSMTRSELHCVMTGGFATVAGAVLAAYISMGVRAQASRAHYVAEILFERAQYRDIVHCGSLRSI